MVILRVEIDSDKDPVLFRMVSRLLTGDMDMICPPLPGAGDWQPIIYGELATTVSKLLKEGAWIEAIKQVRQDRGLNFKDAKRMVDSYRQYLRDKEYLPSEPF
jgi:hypothetical protein